MYHILYRTTMQDSNKFYVGRHSTTNLNDGYLGSGKWVRSIKDKSVLSREILCQVNSEKELIELERLLLEEVIDYPNNMNFNNNASGFAVGELNPAKSEKERKRRSDESWTKTDEGRKFMSENNPSKRKDVKIKRKLQAEKDLANGTHNFQNPSVIEKTALLSKERFLTNNPMLKAENRELASKRTQLELENKTHNFQNPELRELLDKNASIRFKENNPMHNALTKEKFRKSVMSKPYVTCPHCNKVGRGGNMTRFHFDNCVKNSITNLQNL